MTDEDLHRHLIGRQGSRRDLNTPVLVIDRDALDRNVACMAAFARAHGLALRPHAKTHKSADVARRQIAAGAVGQCCAKIGEAEALAAEGIGGLLLTSPVVSEPAIARLAALHARSDGLIATIDHPDNARAIAAAVAAQGRAPLTVLIDVDPGIHRTGVASPEAAVALLGVIRGLPALAYAGVQFYCGSQQHIADYDARAAAMAEKAAYLRTVIAALTAAGGAPRIVSGGGTGTHRIDATLGLFTELQVGSYVFMDDQYRACALTEADDAPFETALMIDARVVSVNAPGMATIDAGLKAMATDAGPPRVLAGADDGARYAFMGDEQGALIGGEALRLADMVTLAAPHCDPTVNLYDHYHVVSGNDLVDIWPVTARGRSR